MDANYIAYETLVANRDASLWAFWSMFAAFLSAATTIVTLCFAYRALSTWRDQEKTKVKLEFRISIKQLKAALLFMPLRIDPDKLDKERKRVNAKWIFKDSDLMTQKIAIGEQNVKQLEDLLRLFDNCQSSWLATEHLFDDTLLANDWAIFEDDFEKYTNGEGTTVPLVKLLNKITAARFVFESK